MDERRLHPRFALNTMYIADADDRLPHSDHFFRVVGIDISRGGLAFESPDRFDVPSKIVVKLQDSHGDSFLVARVVCCLPTESEQHRVSCKFIGRATPDEDGQLQPLSTEYPSLATDSLS